jgi:hypothetical protein
MIIEKFIIDTEGIDTICKNRIMNLIQFEGNPNYDLERMNYYMTISSVFNEINMQISVLLTGDIADFMLKISEGINMKMFEHIDSLFCDEFNELYKEYAMALISIIHRMIQLEPFKEYIIESTGTGYLILTVVTKTSEGY